MRLILYIFVSSLVGFGTHRFYRPSDAFGRRWGTLIRYGMGEAVLLPLRALFRDAFRQQGQTERREEEAISADVLASVSMGIGVLAGHILDRLFGEDDE